MKINRFQTTYGLVPRVIKCVAMDTDFVVGEVTVPTEEMREMTRKIFQDTKLFVITLGLSEVWYRKDTGNF